MPNYRFPTTEELIELNRRVLSEVRVKKADRHQVLSRISLQRALDRAKEVDEDIYRPAAVLLIGIIRGHPFASGVRRTAVVATTAFLRMNGVDSEVPHDPEVLKGIREGFLYGRGSEKVAKGTWYHKAYSSLNPSSCATVKNIWQRTNSF